MKQQKSQALIEFALIFPLFLLLVFGIFYFSSIFSDYMTLNTIARNSAREAAVVSANDDTERNAKYMEIRTRYAKKKLPLDIYTWNPSPSSNDDAYSIIHKDHNVVVNMKATMNQNGSMLATIVDGLSGNKPEALNLSITYTMYSEDNKD
ncbi:TadE family protein [uncultured Mitsuokella sp.]|uniref:TadE family protein n=1 Tax=uncultured Mitsuokella sp. TaxID=453120 RepID=UPI00261E2F92|nr:TadE family protein [uncultured Mitsuokella sp.]